MRRIQIAAIALNQTPLAWTKNRDNIIAALGEAREGGAQVVCFPELAVTGYGCEDAFFGSEVIARAEKSLLEILPYTSGMLVVIGLPAVYNAAIYNTAAVISDTNILGFVAKQHLCGDGIHYEPRWFKPWKSGEVAELSFGGESYPLGDIVFEVDGIRAGVEICEDAWVSNRVGARLAERGVDIIFNPSASHFAFYRRDLRRRIVLEGSRAFGVTYVYTNLLGNEAGRAIYDGSALIASCGQRLVEGKRFSFDDYTITSTVVDLERDRLSRRMRFDVPASSPSPHFGIVGDATPLRAPESVLKLSAPEVWEDSNHLKEEEFSRAVALGLFDYLRKSKSKGFVVSLSGGADSSGVCSLVSLMVALGTEELGTKKFLERIGRADLLGKIPSTGGQSAGAASLPVRSGIVNKILLAVYQRTANSGKVTEEAATQLAASLGADFRVVDVQPLVELYTKLGAEAEGRSFGWESDDLALQNIQARTRAPLVWLLANVRGFLLLSTSNRSEAAVGYATMDGDTCGGLSPIAGIDKAFLRRWLAWLEIEGPSGVGNMPILRLVNAQSPTAELRPKERAQTDEADLMPYPVLDIVERWAIRDKRSPSEVLELLAERFPDSGEHDRKRWVKCFFTLWTRNQWKRERYAPSFHLDDENLDPKTWCRFPILSGGYEDELAEL